MPAPRGRHTTEPATGNVARGAAPVARSLVFCALFSSSWTGLRLSGISLTDYLLTAATAVFVITAPALLLLAIRRNTLNFVVVAVIALTILQSMGLNGRATGPGDMPSDASVVLVQRFVFALALVPALVAALLESRRSRQEAEARRIVAWWTIGITFNCAVALIVPGDAPLLDGLVVHIPTERATGLSDHPNSLAEAASLGITASCWLAYSAPSRGPRLLWLCIVAIQVGALIESESRAGLVIGSLLLVTCGSWALFRSGRWAMGVPAALGAVIVVALFVEQFLANTRFADADAESSSAGRAGNISRGWELFGESPWIGVGMGSWYGELVPVILLTSGGVVLAVIYYLALARTALYKEFAAGGRFLVPLVVGAIIVWGLFNNSLVERYLYWLPALALVPRSLASMRSRSRVLRGASSTPYDA